MSATPATAPPTAPKTTIVARGPWALAWRRFRKDKVALIAAAVMAVIILVAIFAPLINSALGQDPNYQDQVNGLDVNGLPLGPSGAHWLGTDALGRDVFARLVYGARISIGIGILSTGIAVAVGVVLGLLAGYFRGIVDVIIARLLDVVLALPVVLAAVALVAVFGQSPLVTVLVLAFFSWATMARIVRGQVISLREREFIEAARSLGASSTRIMFVELLPNLVMPIIIYFSLLVPVNIVTNAVLAFLGLGIPVPTADWGGMISDAEAGGLYQQAWWLVFFPGGVLVLTTLAFNLLGDGIRDALDPRIERLLRK
ncbi:MAG: ABC transporter permease [Nocardioides sp.]|uniref:ABC transporter permease n=1 Tax=Nocardioides nematodiphilus TaxID=2849669 RepID=UPI001CDA3ED3|nr:ABC transporter permease [Nocardioides nematodiphilus]MCA1982749.1 ABC transporter permease [Nocardioides nematodiphilus]